MKVQVLTFRAVGLSADAIERRSALIELALGEFPGFVSGNTMADPRHGVFGEVAIWADDESLARFRHSELYARLMLAPDVEEPTDQDLPVGAFGSDAGVTPLAA